MASYFTDSSTDDTTTPDCVVKTATLSTKMSPTVSIRRTCQATPCSSIFYTRVWMPDLGPESPQKHRGTLGLPPVTTRTLMIVTWPMGEVTTNMDSKPVTFLWWFQHRNIQQRRQQQQWLPRSSFLGSFGLQKKPSQ